MAFGVRLLFFFLLVVLSVDYVKADVIWPGLVMSLGRLSIPAITCGLISEILFVKYFTKTNWQKAIWLAALMNAVSCTLGGILIAAVTLVWEETAMWEFRQLFHLGILNPVGLISSYLLAVLINTFVEGLIIRKILKLEFKQFFWWLFSANAISILMCGIPYLWQLITTGRIYF